jgi:predicted ATP-dependent endonuclease of OLD family
MANQISKIKELYLASVHARGFKSIRDTKVDFCAGLNIIIGKNAAGKTNLLYFLNQVLNLDYDDLESFYSSLLFRNENSYEIIAERNDFLELQAGGISREEIQPKVLLNGKEIGGNDANNRSPYDVLSGDLIYSTTFICYGVPRNFDLVDIPLTISFNNAGIPDNSLNYIYSASNPYFVKRFFSQFLFVPERSSFTAKQDNIDKIKNYTISKSTELLDEIKPYLNNFTPISDVRLSENFNVTLNSKLEKISISNLFLEFNVNGDWFLFSNLSDGTKRLFYIIAEIAVNNILSISKKTIRIEPKTIPQVILIEEPELGVHPHQLHKLMSFIKEQSLHKQIILTTHSPEVLDSLDGTELNRILIAFIDKKDGTAFRKLSETEISKAKVYMENEYLSDYWRFSDLEK